MYEKTEYTTEDGFVYTVEDDEATITGYTGSQSELTIPGEADGYKVTSIDREVFMYNKNLTKVIVEDNIEEIGVLAFYACSRLKEVILPSSINVIKNYAFRSTAIESISIPSGCEAIAVGAFENNYLTRIDIPDSVVRIGFNESVYDRADSENIALEPTKVTIYANPGSAAETYAKEFGYKFICAGIIDPTLFTISDQDSITLNIGETYQLNTTIEPADASYTTVNQYYQQGSQLLDIDSNGLITAKYAGTTTVFADSLYVKGEYSYAVESEPVTVTVIDPTVYAKSVSIDENSLDFNIDAGLTLQLNATVLPKDTTDKSVTWSTDSTYLYFSSKDVLSLRYLNLPENFLYIPSSVNATVTVRTSNGKTDTATVTIHNDNYSLKPGTGDLGVYDITLTQGESYTFEPSVFPQECMDQLYLEAENTMDAISVDGMTITAQNEGSATIYLNGWGYEKTKCKVYVEPEEIEPDNHAYQVLLNVPYVTIEPGESFQFTAQLVPEDSTDSVTWTSSNSSVATIDSNGLVQGLTEGMTLITATADGGASVVCSVTVEKEEVETSLTLDTVGMSFNVGDSNQLTATVLPATDSVTWTSGNASIASVDQSGKVTGIGKGSCVITATSSSGATGTCEVTILEPEQEASGNTDSGTDTGNKKVSSITFNKSSLTLVKGQTSTDLKVSKLVSASETVQYSSSNNKIAKVNSKTGKITAVATGTVTITVKNQEGSQDTCKIKVKAGKIKLKVLSFKRVRK